MKKYKVKDNGKIDLIVYRRWVEMDSSKYDKKSYVGVTDDIEKRNTCFNKKVSNYAGRKMLEAMDAVPRNNWKLEILEVIEIEDPNDFKPTADERETFYIAKYDSYENGLNGNRGGSGNLMKRDANRTGIIVVVSQCLQKVLSVELLNAEEENNRLRPVKGKVRQIAERNAPPK